MPGRSARYARRSLRRALLVLLAAVVLPQCAVVERVAPVKPSSWQELSPAECRAVVRDDSDPATLQRAAAQSLEYYRRLPEDRELRLLDRRVSVREMRSVVESLFAQPLPPGNAAALCDRFRLLRAKLPKPLLVTGYYQPELDARRRRSERFRYPLYALPDDRVEVDLTPFCPACAGRRAVGRVVQGELVPYYTRAEIDAGALAGHARAIAWLADPVDAFFVQVQGSALLRFADGVHLQVGFNGSNGRPYTSIGRVLIDAGKMSAEQVSLDSLKAYLHAHPEERDAILARDERYVFFRVVPAGPVGSLGVPLTAGRSVAADPRVYPPGALVFLQIHAGTESRPRTISRLALLQDAGAAIQGPRRLDVFWGTGETAEAIAGGMQAAGEIYFLLPR